MNWLILNSLTKFGSIILVSLKSISWLIKVHGSIRLVKIASSSFLLFQSRCYKTLYDRCSPVVYKRPYLEQFDPNRQQLQNKTSYLINQIEKVDFR